MHLPTECWMEIFKWLEQPAQIENISLVNYWFYDIIYTNLAKKYGKEKHQRKIPDLRFSRGRGSAKLCELGRTVPYNRERVQKPAYRWFPIAEVPPPEYIRPFYRVFVHHFDDQVLSFFNAIRQWFQRGFLLVVNFRKFDADAKGNVFLSAITNFNGEFPFRQLIHTADFIKFKMFARQALLGHCFELDCEDIADNKPRQPIANLLDEEFVLSIPRIQGFIFDEAFMIRWLFTPTTDGAQRVWIMWHFSSEMKNRIVEEFINATVAQKFFVIFGTLHRNNYKFPWVIPPPPTIEETRNQRTQECLRYCPNNLTQFGSELDCIIRQPICEGAPDFNEINIIFKKIIHRFQFIDRPSIDLFAPICIETIAEETTIEMESGSSRLL